MKAVVLIVAALFATAGAEARDITFESAGYRLEGTLTLPEGAPALAGVLIIPGSGPINRDGSTRLAPSLPPFYRQWGDALTRAGYGVLRYDKRFLTHPGIDIPSFDEEAQIADALAAAAFLRAQPGMQRVFVLGHSEGGTIAAVIAARSAEIAGLAVVNSVQFPVDELLLEQLAANPGMPKSSVEQVRRALVAIKEGIFPKDELLLGAGGRYWAQWITYSRRSPEILAALSMPVLLVQSLDDESLPSGNLARNIAQLRAVAQANKRAQLRELQGHDHFGALRGKREPSPEFLQALFEWLKSSR